MARPAPAKERFHPDLAAHVAVDPHQPFRWPIALGATGLDDQGDPSGASVSGPTWRGTIWAVEALDSSRNSRDASISW